MEYESTRFITMLKNYGILRCILSIETYVGLGVSAVIWFWPLPVDQTTTSRMIECWINISAGLLAILIAGLAIVVATTDIDYLLFLRSSKVLTNLLFPYWLIAMVWAISIPVGLLALLLSQVGGVPRICQVTINAGLGFLGGYALAGTTGLFGTTLRFLLYRVEFYDARPSDEKTEPDS